MGSLTRSAKRHNAKQQEKSDPEALIRRVLEKLSKDEVDQLAPDGGEFGEIAEAVMAWYSMLLASNVVKRGNKAIETLASSLLVLATLVKAVYALGVRRGRQQEGQG